MRCLSPRLASVAGILVGLSLLLTVLFSLRAVAQSQGKQFVEVPAGKTVDVKEVYGASHALLIGINRYKNAPASLQLHYAVKDVEDLKQVLIKSYGFKAENITVLENEQATLSNIRHALSSLANKQKVTSEDRLLVYFSGHGQTVALPDSGDMGFLIPTDADVDFKDDTNIGPYLDTCLQMSEVWSRLDASPAKHVLLMADACYSGLLAAPRSPGGLNAASLQVWAGRRARQVVTAGGKGETSEENSNVGHGVFTFQLLQELKARAQEPGSVFTTTELYSVLFPAVSNQTNAKQNPQLAKYKVEGEFLFITAGKSLSPIKPPLDPVPDPMDVNTNGSIVITSEPPGADVIIDEQVVGHTPYTLMQELGEKKKLDVEVALRLSGYKTRVVKVSLLRGQSQTSRAIALVKSVPIKPKPHDDNNDNGAPARTKTNAKDNAEMILIPAGDFLMGDADQSDNPRHTVTLSAYYIYKNLVTVKQFREYDAANGSKYDWEGHKPDWGWKDDHPMVRVTWEEANAYCRWAGGHLPTEAQWEKAARGMEGLKYPWGDTWDGSRLSHSASAFGDAKSTAPVGSFPTGASPYGVLDMAGNVWQWCADWYDKDYPKSAPARNPTGPETGQGRVLRGGSWNLTTPGNFRAAYRFRFDPADRFDYCGFRVASGL